MKTVFSLEDVRYAYPDGGALDGVRFSISEGECVGILGANGCGKSTLLGLLAGLYAPQSGRFLAFGEEMTPKRLGNDAFCFDYHRRVGFLFQDSDVQLFCPTVRDELAFGPLHAGLSEQDALRQAEEAAGRFDLTALLDKPPYHLSGGEKKRVALACVLSLRPQALLLDEPTASLDPRSRRFITNELLALRDAGVTLLFATHDLTLAHTLARRVLLLGEDHRLAVDGPASTLLDDEALLTSLNLL